MRLVKRLLKQIRIKNLRFFSIFHRNRYMKHFCKIYKKYGVIFNDGLPRYIAPNVVLDTSEHIYIGSGATIASETIVLTHDHSFDYAFITLEKERDHEYGLFKEVKIGNNVFIGQRCIVLPGVVINDNVIVGAGSIVTKELASNYVYAGVPAKPICSIEDWYKKRIESNPNIR